MTVPKLFDYSRSKYLTFFGAEFCCCLCTSAYLGTVYKVSKYCFINEDDFLQVKYNALVHVTLWTFLISGLFGYGLARFYNATRLINGIWVFMAFGLVSFTLLILIHFRLRRRFVERILTSDNEKTEGIFKSCFIVSVLNCCAYGQMGAFAMDSVNEEYFL